MFKCNMRSDILLYSFIRPVWGYCFKRVKILISFWTHDVSCCYCLIYMGSIYSLHLFCELLARDD